MIGTFTSQRSTDCFVKRDATDTAVARASSWSLRRFFQAGSTWGAEAIDPGQRAASSRHSSSMVR